MPDYAKIWIEIMFYDQWALPDEEPERWKKTKDEIERAVQEVLAKNGFGLDEYDVTVGGE